MTKRFTFLKTVAATAFVFFISQTLYAQNSLLTKKKLANNIPVYIMQNGSNRMYAVYIVVQGGTSLLSPDKSGLEYALFSMMTVGSEKYPYDELKSIEYKTKSTVSRASLNEGSILELNCIDYYFDTMLPVLADGFLHPSFDQEQYENLMKNFRQNIQEMNTEPGSILMYNVEKTLYKNHPYETMTTVTEDSIDAITIDNMKKLHDTLLDANRISIVAVGKFNEKSLLNKLNKTLGKIPSSGKPFVPATVEPIVVGGKPQVYTSPSAAGTGFVLQTFSSPSIESDDYVPSCIAANMYSELLYGIVREQYGACYTPSSSVVSSKAPFGMVLLYQVSDLEHCASYVAQAQSLMQQGKIISGKSFDGSFMYADIGERLEGYVNSYLNSKYQGMQTNRGVAAKIAGSILQFNEPEKYLSLMKQARTVTADDIVRVFTKYWCSQGSQWFAVVGPADKEKAQASLP